MGRKRRRSLCNSTYAPGSYAEAVNRGMVDAKVLAEQVERGTNKNCENCDGFPSNINSNILGIGIGAGAGIDTLNPSLIEQIIKAVGTAGVIVAGIAAAPVVAAVGVIGFGGIYLAHSSGLTTKIVEKTTVEVTKLEVAAIEMLKETAVKVAEYENILFAKKTKERSKHPPAKRVRVNSKKDAKEAAKKAGKGKDPIHHPNNGSHGPHYHPDVPQPPNWTPKGP